MLTKQVILDSIKVVVDQSTFVSIDEDAIDRYVKNFAPTKTVHWGKVYPLNYNSNRSKEDEIGFLIILGNQAFCYWGYPTKWTIDYRNQKLDGWWGNIAAFERAVEAGNNIVDGNFLAELTLEKTREIYRGEPEIPLLEERFEMMKVIGEKLVERYQGKFVNFYEENKQDAFTLVEALSKEFRGFDDVPKYKGKEVFFYKKTQVVLADINHLVEKVAKFEEMHGFADYKIPAIMRTQGLIKYSEELAQKVDNRIEIPEASEMEVEIRSNMLWACNLIVEKLKERNIEISPIDFENVLWIESQDKSKIDKPYHLTKTIYY